MKYLARLIFEVRDNQLKENSLFQAVYVSGTPQLVEMTELSRVALEHLTKAVDVNRLNSDSVIYLMLAGDVQIRTIPRHSNWYFDPKIEWSSLEVTSWFHLKNGDGQYAIDLAHDI